jgi:hypothetical protein
MIYAYKCNACGGREDRIATIDERDKQVCLCGHKLVQDYSRKNIITFNETLEYYDHQLGKYISGYSDRKKKEREAGVYAISSDELKSVKKRKPKIDEKKVRKSIEKAMNDLENGKRADV